MPFKRKISTLQSPKRSSRRVTKDKRRVSRDKSVKKDQYAKASRL